MLFLTLVNYILFLLLLIALKQEAFKHKVYKNDRPLFITLTETNDEENAKPVRHIEVPIDKIDLLLEDVPVVVVGTIIKFHKRIVAKSIFFECPSCGKSIEVLQDKEYETMPVRCSCGRRGDGFKRGTPILEEVADLMLQGKEHHLTAKRVPFVSIRNVSVGDEARVFGKIHFEQMQTRHGKNINEYTPFILPTKVELIKKGTKIDPRKYLETINGFEFEQLIGKVLRSKGNSAVVTQKTGDGGIDIDAVIDGEKTAVQCKHHLNKTITRADIDNLIGVMARDKIKKGLFVCTGKFSKSTQETAEQNNITLWDLDKVISELISLGDFKIGGENETQLSQIRPKELKKKIKEVYKQFLKRYKEISKATKSTSVPTDTIKGLFQNNDWKLVSSTAQKQGFVIDKDVIEKLQHKEISENEIPERNKIHMIREIIRNLTKEDRTISIEKIKIAAKDHNLTEKEVVEIIGNLKRHGDLYEPRPGYISFI